ncbi:hypothetical protein [Gynuella sunshinyii]|uniref:Uncharacterized protein n=1 Tax=Gynuella sunshinyii YC6258 TaxID=1445510 RepID=A0A0C5VFN1_9GAMM|nr:hypothetical protein [Gynuella sunshinyii]AJQ93372.1 hypothetical Protein YC6258_01324 [Gynuella sunshinyii YC6258]
MLKIVFIILMSFVAQVVNACAVVSDQVFLEAAKKSELVFTANIASRDKNGVVSASISEVFNGTLSAGRVVEFEDKSGTLKVGVYY